MDKWITKIWLPLLLLALAVAMYFESTSVKTIDLDSGYSPPSVSQPLVAQSPQRTGQGGPRDQATRKSRLVAGVRFASMNELVADQQIAGYVRTGYFGKFWPSTVTEIATAKNGISFVRQDGTRHNYTKFYGYRMKMVRLRSAGDKETIVVFRSLNKR